MDYIGKLLGLHGDYGTPKRSEELSTFLLGRGARRLPDKGSPLALWEPGMISWGSGLALRGLDIRIPIVPSLLMEGAIDRGSTPKPYKPLCKPGFHTVRERRLHEGCEIHLLPA